MAVFDPKSRYVIPPLEQYTVIDERGRLVQVLPMPEQSLEITVGDVVRKQGQRLDHLAAALLNDPHAFWRIVEVNGAFLPDALAELERLAIPSPARVRKRRA